MKISRALVHRNLISYSCSWTCFPGRLPRTVLFGFEVSAVPRSSSRAAWPPHSPAYMTSLE